MYNIFWLPILFIIHDFEEIIFVPKWVHEHQNILKKEKHPLFGGVSNSSSLSVGVLEEFLVLVFVSILSMYNHNNMIYLGFFMAYFIHLVFHILFCIKYRGYVPGVITAIIQIPLCIYIIHNIYFTLNQSCFYIITNSLVCIIIVFINLLLVHKLISFIETNNLLK